MSRQRSAAGPLASADADRPRGRGLASIERPVALDSHAMPLPLVRPVVPDREVLRAAIVPERHVVLLPAEPDLVVGAFDVPEKELQQRLTLGRLQSLEARGEDAVHEDSLLPGLGMRADDRMLRAGIDLAGVLLRPLVPV